MNENIRPFSQISQKLDLDNDLFVCLNDWHFFAPFQTFSDFVKFVTRRLYMDCIHQFKVRYGSYYTYDAWKHFVSKHTWFPITSTMQCNRTFSRRKTDHYWLSKRPISIFQINGSFFRTNSCILQRWVLCGTYVIGSCSNTYDMDSKCELQELKSILDLPFMRLCF